MSIQKKIKEPTLKEVAQRFGVEASRLKHNPEAVKKVWLTYSDWINSKTANKGKPYSIHTITKFTTMSRKALLSQVEEEFQDLLLIIETKDGVRRKKWKADKEAVDPYVFGEVSLTVKSPSRLIGEALEISLNSWHVNEIIPALGLLTGRRCSEVVMIAAKGGFQYVDKKHIKVKGLLKGGESQAIIPVFGGSTQVIKAFSNLGNLLGEEVEKMNSDQVKRRYQSNASKQAKALLEPYLSVTIPKSYKGKPFSISMHLTRKIYTALCIELVYGNSELLPASRSRFISQVLAHKSGSFDQNYDFIQVNKDGLLW